MNFQIRAFQISFLLHGLIVVLAVIFGTHMVPCKKMLVVDFDLLKPAAGGKEVKLPAPVPVIKGKRIEPKAPQSAIKKEPLLPLEEKPRITTSPDIPPMVKLPETRKLDSSQAEPGIPVRAEAIKEESVEITGVSEEKSRTNAVTNEPECLEKGTGTDGNGDCGIEAAKRQYLNDHFAYIRDKILRNVSYPDAARRMGWEGKVLLSFIITADGSVRALKIMQSSGFKILDSNAIETVCDTAPFPRPPDEARLVIPIVYRLE